EPTHADVVEEEQRSRALDENVIDAVIDEIQSHRIVTVGHHGHLQLRADTVRTRDHHRLAIPARYTEQSAEAASPRHYTCRARRLDQLRNAALRPVRDLTIDASFAVA